jgi:hypothetical protein
MAWKVHGSTARESQKIFLFSKMYRPALRPKYPPIQQVLGALSLQVRQMGSENDHCFSSVRVNNMQSGYIKIGQVAQQTQVKFHSQF